MTEDILIREILNEVLMRFSLLYTGMPDTLDSETAKMGWKRWMGKRQRQKVGDCTYVHHHQKENQTLRTVFAFQMPRLNSTPTSISRAMGIISPTVSGHMLQVFPPK